MVVIEQSESTKCLVDKLFEMIDQECKDHGRLYQVLADSRICCKELGGGEGSKL